MSIKCSVRSCAHNDDQGHCYAESVVVRGVNSMRTDETLCKSFVEQSPKAYMNEFSHEHNQGAHAATTQNIRCSAIRCKHNADNTCHATNVQINRETTACHTFEQ